MSELKPCHVQKIWPLPEDIDYKCNSCPNRRADQQAVNDALERAAVKIEAAITELEPYGRPHPLFCAGLNRAAAIVRGCKDG